jgi:dienelactone hydrolase
MTVTGEIQDLGSAIAFAHTIPCLEGSPVYLIGYSLGGAIALATAAGGQRVYGVVCWAPASDLTAVFTTILGSETFLAAPGRRHSMQERLQAIPPQVRFFL